MDGDRVMIKGLSPKMTTRIMQEYWESDERRLEAICQIIKELEAIILSPNSFLVEKRDAEKRMEIMQIRKARLTQQQNEVENWLVENEAPGWTST